MATGGGGGGGESATAIDAAAAPPAPAPVDLWPEALEPAAPRVGARRWQVTDDDLLPRGSRPYELHFVDGHAHRGLAPTLVLQFRRHPTPSASGRTPDFRAVVSTNDALPAFREQHWDMACTLLDTVDEVVRGEYSHQVRLTDAAHPGVPATRAERAADMGVALDYASKVGMQLVHRQGAAADMYVLLRFWWSQLTARHLGTHDPHKYLPARFIRRRDEWDPRVMPRLQLMRTWYVLQRNRMRIDYTGLYSTIESVGLIGGGSPMMWYDDATAADTDDFDAAVSRLHRATLQQFRLYEQNPRHVPELRKITFRTWQRLTLGLYEVLRNVSEGLRRVAGPDGARMASTIFDQEIGRFFATAAERRLRALPNFALPDDVLWRQGPLFDERSPFRHHERKFITEMYVPYLLDVERGTQSPHQPQRRRVDDDDDAHERQRRLDVLRMLHVVEDDAARTADRQRQGMAERAVSATTIFPLI